MIVCGGCHEIYFDHWCPGSKNFRNYFYTFDPEKQVNFWDKRVYSSFYININNFIILIFEICSNLKLLIVKKNVAKKNHQHCRIFWENVIYAFKLIFEFIKTVMYILKIFWTIRKISVKYINVIFVFISYM